LIEDALAGYAGSAPVPLDWSRCPVVESVPGKPSGAWVLKNTRMPVATIFENLEAGASLDNILVRRPRPRTGQGRDRVCHPQPQHTRPPRRFLFVRFSPATRSGRRPSSTWDRLKNGDLLTAEGAGFEVLLTTDRNMRSQQNLTARTIAIVVIDHPQWPIPSLTSSVSWPQ
jgi:Protein of unknown function (DUF433)